jgi:transposase InsO family protein
MSSSRETPKIALPKGWKKQVRSAVLHVISLAQYSTIYTRGWAADSSNQRVRLKAELDRSNQEIVLLREELRIKDARLARIDPHRRPHYPPTERMAILQIRSARGWSLEQTGRVFHLTAATITSWMKRLEEHGAEALVQVREPVNRFPDYVRYLVQRLKTLCPTMGKRKLAETLARAGLHLGVTTVGRILKEKPVTSPPADQEGESKGQATGRVVTAKRPNHVWHVDLTAVPIGAGLWCPWLGCALPQRWPFCWWVLVTVDHFSRVAVGAGVFAKRPDCRAVCACLGQTVRRVGTAPKYVVCDRERIFDGAAFRRWAKRKGIQPPRYGAVGQHGSIAVVERFILTLKQIMGQLQLIPLRRQSFRKELDAILLWYNKHRPHTTLGGKTPHEVYEKRFPGNRKPRVEPRPRWPRGSPCARPQTLVAGKPGDRFNVIVSYQGKRRHLPIMSLSRAA